jgi:hypothetical protein
MKIAREREQGIILHTVHTVRGKIYMRSLCLCDGLLDYASSCRVRHDEAIMQAVSLWLFQANHVVKQKDGRPQRMRLIATCGRPLNANGFGLSNRKDESAGTLFGTGLTTVCL